MKLILSCVLLQFVSQHASAADVSEGDTFLLLCEFPTFDIYPTPFVVWSRHDLTPSTVHQRQLDGDALEEQNQLFRGRTSMATDALDSGDLSLTLTGLKASDSGTYTCSVTGSRGERHVTDVRLQVKELFPSWATALLVGFSVLCVVVVGPVLRFRHYFMSVYQVKVRSGAASVQLPCRTMRCPNTNVRVEWRNNYNSLVHRYPPGSGPDQTRRLTEMQRNPLRRGDLSLTLKHPTANDSGSWTCSVYDRDTEILEKCVLLRVKVHKVLVDPDVEFVLLPCKATADSPEVATVVWTVGSDKVVFQNGSDPPAEQDWCYRHRTEMNPRRPGDLSLTLKHPTDIDKNTFTCTAFGADGGVLMKKEVKLQVKDCQVEAEEGVESVLLPFRTTGNLPADVLVEWRREDLTRPVHKYHSGSEQPQQQEQRYRGRTEMRGDLLGTGDLSLSLRSPNRGDAGTYVCEVYNAGLRRTKTVQLGVKERTTGCRRSRRDSAGPLMADQAV